MPWGKKYKACNTLIKAPLIPISFKGLLHFKVIKYESLSPVVCSNLVNRMEYHYCRESLVPTAVVLGHFLHWSLQCTDHFSSKLALTNPTSNIIQLSSGIYLLGLHMSAITSKYQITCVVKTGYQMLSQYLSLIMYQEYLFVS